MRKLSVALLAVLLAGSLLVAGTPVGEQVTTQSEHTVEQDQTFVRVVHASPNAPAVDVYVDEQPVLTNVSFGTVSDYLSVAPGEHDVTITAAGDAEAVVFDGAVTLEARETTTIAATGEIGDEANVSQPFAPVAFDDDALAPGENASVVRVVHASPDAPAVDVTVTVDNTTTVLADNVSFRNASDYVTVPAGDYTVDIRAATANDSGPIVTSFEVPLEGGTVYTAMAVGYLDPTAAPADTPFQLLLTQDAQTTITLPGQEMDDEETPTPGETATATPNGTATETATETP